MNEQERKEVLEAPFIRKRDKVALVGFSQKTRDMAPFADDTWEIWGLNEEYNWFPKKVGDEVVVESWLKRFDRWFQMHPREDFMRENNTNDRNHPFWLLNQSGTCKWCKGTMLWKNYLKAGAEEKCPFCDEGIFTPNEKRQNLTIYMQQAWPDIPGSVAYPIKELADHLMPESMKKTHREFYFRSSPAFMFVLAIAMGYKTIGIYGFEMDTDTEYHYQRANFEYWIGRAQSLGIEVVLPEESALMHGEVYAYETLKVGYRQDLEMRKIFLEQMAKNAEMDTKLKEGAHNALNALWKSGKFTDEEIKASVKAAKLAHAKAQAIYNFKRGAWREVEMQMNMYDAYFNSETRETVEDTEKMVNTDYVFDAPEEVKDA